MSSLPSVRNRTVPGGRHLTQREANRRRNGDPFLRTGLRVFGEPWNNKSGALTTLTGLHVALFRFRKEWHVMFLSLEGHRLVSQFLGLGAGPRQMEEYGME